MDGTDATSSLIEKEKGCCDNNSQKDTFLAYFPYFEKEKKNNKRRLMRSPFCVLVNPPLPNFEILSQYLLNLVCMSRLLNPSERRKS
jgi:hypothetical protein